MRTIKFKRTPTPVTELLEDQLEGALQIIAALVLTDEEVIDIKVAHDPEVRPDNMRGWAEEMKRDLLSEDGRAELVGMLRKRGFFTNTHRGFPLGRLCEAPTNLRAVARAYVSLEKMLKAHAKGLGPEVDAEDIETYWTHRLLAKGYSPEVVTWVMRDEGSSLASLAGLERLMLLAGHRKPKGG